ncbi:APC family permease [Streptomyces halobius]|uniref:APC family permease n=1 Tax=Streptomyces halobius TaxID=2879846 RepID=A0ABY4LZR1_9ACTN|nr:APC family permease [Streptomyces halobius]UQA90987.1 APC family permease [Streptomyces halobius]
MSVPAPVPHLKRSLRRFDIMALGVAAVISIDVIGQIASGGGQSVTWIAVMAVSFLLPYALIFAETGAAFPYEGGPYAWVELAFGRLVAALTSMFYWVTNPVWLGGSLAFIGAGAWDGFVSPLGSGTAADYVFKLAFVWGAILTAIISLRRGKWITTTGAAAKLLALAFFTGTAVAYGIRHGFQGLQNAAFSPTGAGFLALVPVLIFAMVGFEAPNAAGEEMYDPQRDVPIAIGVSGAIATSCYLLPVLAILSAAPAGQITGIGGFMDAAGLVFEVYGDWRGPLLTGTGVLFVVALLTQGSAWMIVVDRMQAMAAAEGGFFSRWLGAFHARLGTPVRMNVLSGLTATAFMVAAMNLGSGDASDTFAVVLTVAITTLLLSYLAIVPALLALRVRRPEIHRPYHVPFGTRGFAVATVLVYAWVLLGSWVALFPGTLEPLFGITYDFREIWGVSRMSFEVFTLGTVLLLLAVGVAGYLAQRMHLRRHHPDDHGCMGDDRSSPP